ncbi:MAG: ureidoglycolate lyase [Candidatus Omnitrophica bacterium]|nr:ureidoglycolate lyase [Candidatus Omnitrophota bacterium]MBU1924827.1 ureidoglycolate lyase [Candidatus Omnitrophota bacterium]MBU2062973.1 ureidoglycolate lyase [Candidatus Omnitrophota bacterium]
MNITAKKINKNNFKKFGWVIEWQGPENKKSKNQFRIVVNDAKVTGWRIAYLIVREKRINRLERHPYSMESFEPVKGKSILYVSTQKKPRDIEAFILDKPIVLKKGIWHGIVTLGQQAHVKITENNTVHMRILELDEWIPAKSKRGLK